MGVRVAGSLDCLNLLKFHLHRYALNSIQTTHYEEKCIYESLFFEAQICFTKYEKNFETIEKQEKTNSNGRSSSRKLGKRNYEWSERQHGKLEKKGLR